jgi:glutamate dehydrogenase (NADP+)
MVGMDKVKRGIARYLDEEFTNKMTGWQKWVFGAAAALYLENLSATIDRLRQNDLIRGMNLLDETNGIAVEKIYQHRGLISEYVDYVPAAKFVEGPKNMWLDVKADVVLPCATQNEIDEEAAKAIVANGAMALAEGANMPCTPEAIKVYKEAGILYAPGKAANAGGVATSGLEMTQNSERLSWTFEEVDAKLESIMKNIYKSCVDAAAEYGFGYDLEAGANIAGFKKVAEAMIAQGVAY